MKTSSKTDRTPEVRSKTETRGKIRSWFKDISPTNPIRVMNQEVYNKTEVDKVTGSEVVEKIRRINASSNSRVRRRDNANGVRISRNDK